MFAMRCARTVSGSVATHRFLDRQALQQLTRRAVGLLERLVDVARVGDQLERGPCHRVTEEVAVEPVGHELGIVDRVQQHVELAAIHPNGWARVTTMRRPVATRRFVARLRTPAHLGWSAGALTAPGTFHRVAHAIGVDVEGARELHDVLVAHEVARVLGHEQHAFVTRGPGPPTT